MFPRKSLSDCGAAFFNAKRLLSLIYNLGPIYEIYWSQFLTGYLFVLK